MVLLRSGEVLSARISRRSGLPALDKSVEAALNRVKRVAPFPEGSKDEQRSFTIELIHHGTDNRGLLEKAEKVHLLTLHAVKAFDNLLKNNAAEAEMLSALREWARKTNKDLDYDNLRKVLQGRDSRTPRELLADLKTLDAAESEGMPERELGEIYARFVKRHRISLVPADSAVQSSGVLRTNGA